MTCFKLQGTGTGPWHECGRPWQTRDLLWEEGEEENCEDEGGQGGGQVGQGLLQGLIRDLWTKETLEEEGIHDHRNIQVTAIASANISHTALSLANDFQFVTCQSVFENKVSKHFVRELSKIGLLRPNVICVPISEIGPSGKIELTIWAEIALKRFSQRGGSRMWIFHVFIGVAAFIFTAFQQTAN